jgi:hypothetical protein
MKKLLVSLLLVAFMAASAWAAGAMFKDVPANHWAYDAIQKVVDAGVLKGYPGDYFKGKKLLNRYQFAVAIAKVLDKINAGGASLNPDELAALKSLTKEFADELAALKDKVSDHESRIAALERKVFGKGGSTVSAKEEKTSNEDSGWEEDDTGSTNEDDTWNDEEKTAKKESSAASDEDYSVTEKWYIGATANWYQPDSFEWNNTTAGTTDNPADNLLDTDIYVRGHLGYTFKNNWRVEVGGGKWSNDDTVLASGDSNVSDSYNYLMDNASASTTDSLNNYYYNYDVKPIELDVSYMFNNKNPRLKPYVGVGGGVYTVTGDYTWRKSDNTALLNIHNDVDVTVFNVHAGFDYFVSKEFALRLDLRYVFGDDDLRVGANDITVSSGATLIDKATLADRYNKLADKIKLDGFMVGVGFTYYFE